MNGFPLRIVSLVLIVALGVLVAPSPTPAAGRPASDPGRLATVANWIHRLHVARANRRAARRADVAVVGLPATASTAEWWVWSTPVERHDPAGPALGFLTYWDLGAAPTSRTPPPRRVRHGSRAHR